MENIQKAMQNWLQGDLWQPVVATMIKAHAYVVRVQ